MRHIQTTLSLLSMISFSIYISQFPSTWTVTGSSGGFFLFTMVTVLLISGSMVLTRRSAKYREMVDKVGAKWRGGRVNGIDGEGGWVSSALYDFIYTIFTLATSITCATASSNCQRWQSTDVHWKDFSCGGASFAAAMSFFTLFTFLTTASTTIRVAWPIFLGRGNATAPGEETSELEESILSERAKQKAARTAAKGMIRGLTGL
ncbi:hypothetical protein HDV00_006090 [Rhizophlyctis rosea]|nr:hypothetical protein HDV00_006090 [Rhizophlyctis rosea]